MVDDEKALIDYLKKVSPGTSLRIIIDDLLRSGLGGLIVFDSPDLHNIIEGGFKVNCSFTSQRLYELCKMDGAIIVSPDLKRILYANVLLAPDISVHTRETGTRHKAGERTAKQANTFVIVVSERKKKTTIYFHENKYILRNPEELSRKISSNLQVLEKQREIFNETISKLNVLEMSNLVSVSDVCKVIQRAEIILKISDSVKINFIEIGVEGSIMHLRYRELIRGIEKLEDEVLRDYGIISLKKAKNLLSNLTFEGLLDLESISRLVLGKGLEESISSRGYRFLSYLDLSKKEISQIVEISKSIDKIFDNNPEIFEKVLKGKAKKIKEEINSLREQILAGKIIY